MSLESRSAADGFASVRRRTRARRGLSAPGEFERIDANEGLLSGDVRSVLDIAWRSLWSKGDFYHEFISILLVEVTS